MASSWADEMAEEAGMRALNFTALLNDTQAAARNGLSSGDEETAATSGQRRKGSRALVADRAVDRPPVIRPASSAAATSASTRLALQPMERQIVQRGAPPPPFIARPDPRPVAPILVGEQQPGQPPNAWPVEHGIRVDNGLHDLAAIMQGRNERPIELDQRQEEYALPRAPAQLMDFLNLLRTIGLLQLTWRQAGLPDGGQMPGKFTWSTNTSCRRCFGSSFKVPSATLRPSA